LRFANTFPTRDRLVITLNKDHLVSGKLRTLKDQLTGSCTQGVYPDRQECEMTWSSVGGDAGSFCMEGRMAFAEGEKGVVVVIAGSRPISVDETKTRYLLSIPWDASAGDDEIHVCLAVGEDRGDTLAQARRVCENAPAVIDRRIADAVADGRTAPAIRIEAFPQATEFARTVGPFERAMVFAETEKEACIRAATHKYGFFPMWDQIYPARVFQILGDYETAEKLLRYMLTLPRVEANFWITVQMINAVDDCVACSGKNAFAREAYPTLKRFFDVAAGSADSRTGLLQVDNTSGVDDPAEIGIAGMIWPSCINGWWYGACRSMENFAILTGDAGTAAAARAVGDTVCAHYLEVFFDEGRGYLHAAVDPATGHGVGTYQNVSTLGLDYPYGKYLLRSRLRQLGEYQAYALYHPAGRSAVAYDDEADEMWKNVLMFQHIAHETKLARAVGMAEEAIRIVGTFMRIFDRCKVGIETHNLTGCDGDNRQKANWQAFGAGAACDALVEGIIGIQWDSGGLAYVPCDIGGPMALENFRFRDGVWNITLSGTGGYVERFEVDGEELTGTTRLPAELVEQTGTHALTIVRSDRPFPRPTLLNAPGAAVSELTSADTELSFTVRSEVHTSIEACCPTRPSVSLNGQPIACEWSEATGILWCDAVIQPGHRLRIGL
jgi:hypothetical protein